MLSKYFGDCLFFDILLYKLFIEWKFGILFVIEILVFVKKIIWLELFMIFFNCWIFGFFICFYFIIIDIM